MSTPHPRRCTHCGGTTLAPGYLGSSSSEDKGTYERWYDGPLDLTVFGDVKHASSRSWFQVIAYRCENCAHIELFADAQN